MTAQGMALQAQAPQVQHDPPQVMRRFGRQWRGRGNVLVTLVRQTETPWLELGAQVLPVARAAQACLHSMMPLSEDQRARLDAPLTAALVAHQRSERQARRMTQGQALTHGTIVHAYAPTMAPMCTGKSHCPVQCGRKPGMIAEPTAGFIVALHLPVGNPREAS